MDIGQAAWILLAMLVGALLATLGLWARFRLFISHQAEAELARARHELAAREADAEQLRTMFQALLEHFPKPVLATDRGRVIRFANAAALELFRLPREQVVGRLAATVIQDYETTHLLMEAAETGIPQERTLLRPVTRQTWRVIVTPLRFSSVSEEDVRNFPGATRIIMTIEDLTELRRLETVRRDFVSHVSHELRTPLAATKLLAETLVRVLDENPAAAREFALRIGSQIDHLSQMVAELLELSRIESGKITLRVEPTDIAGVVEVVMDRMCPLADARRLTLRSTLPSNLPDVRADANRIGEVLVNLIHNAIKYTPEGGEITISGRRAYDTHDRPEVVVSVTDTGIGISDDDLGRVFERFFKADRSRTRAAAAASPHESEVGIATDISERSAAAGTGLGLAIARHLIGLHGGRIWAMSRLGQGSTFSFSLPVSQTPLTPNGSGGDVAVDDEDAAAAATTAKGV